MKSANKIADALLKSDGSTLITASDNEAKKALKAKKVISWGNVHFITGYLITKPQVLPRDLEMQLLSGQIKVQLEMLNMLALQL